MSTWKNFGACIFGYFLTLFFRTNIIKCFNSHMTCISFSEGIFAISALYWILKLCVLSASFSKMIWSCVAQPALLLLAWRIRAYKSIFGVVLSLCFCYILPCSISLRSISWLSFHKLIFMLTFATFNCGDWFHQDFPIHLIINLRSQNILNLLIWNISFTPLE